MGLLDEILGGMMGGQPGNQQANQRGAGMQAAPQGAALLAMAMQFIQSYPGGLAGLLQAFGKAGYGKQAASWVGTGQNMQIPPEVIGQILGGQQDLQSMGRQAGVDSQMASGGLASLLPEIINQLTPSGQLEPQHEQAQGDELGALLESVRGRMLG